MPAKKILIVEDNQDLVLGIRLYLQHSGYTTVSAADGLSGIKMAVEEAPDLILLDLGLPDNDGFTVMDLLHQLTPTKGIPTIVISARPQEFYKEACLLAGARTYFQKPFDNDLLLEAIETALGAAPK